MKNICKLIWELSEFYRIPLGRFAPFIFSKMIGIKGKKQSNKNKYFNK